MAQMSLPRKEIWELGKAAVCVCVRWESPAQGRSTQCFFTHTPALHQGCRLPPWQGAASRHRVTRVQSTAAVCDSHRGASKAPVLPVKLWRCPLRVRKYCTCCRSQMFSPGLCISEAKFCKWAHSHCCYYNIICIQTIKTKPITSYLHA